MVRRGGRASAHDRGLTLVELLITVVVLGICMTLFGAAVLSATRTIRRQTGGVDAQTSTRTAFEVLDKQIRYANAVSTPSSGTDPQWIEWQLPDPLVSPSVSSTQTRCYQWAASPSAGTLRYRTWVVPTAGAATASSWVTVATGLVIGSQPVFSTSAAALQAAPFLLPATGQAFTLHQAQVGVALTASFNNPPGRSVASSVFTALNSGAAAAGPVCTQVARS